MWIEAKNIEPGSTIDIDGNAPYVSEANKPCVENEYVYVETVNGGWADSVAAPGEVVLYSASNLAEPVVLSGTSKVWLINRPGEVVE